LQAPGRKKHGSDVIATSGEILAEEVDGIFDRDSATDDTRVRAAISWLEEATLLSLQKNHAQVFPSRFGSLRLRKPKRSSKARGCSKTTGASCSRWYMR
jgi:ATP-dependent DNA helicase RecQ